MATFPRQRPRPYARWLCRLCFSAWVACATLMAAGNATATDSIQITHAAPDARGGQAYRMTYQVDLPLDVYWRFKTDFDNTFLEANPYILSHRLISRSGDTVVTENYYKSLPEVYFRWQTRIMAERHRLEFELIATNQTGNRFHYGFIQLYADNGRTRVVQVARFDFWGASFWSKYPWRGGMRSFLKDTAEWEREAAAAHAGKAHE
ncbi:MAG: hypothetical protein VR64_03270 [Desulfatitalea sp. BRH_c12]|nr:MAG: hypothetical protein VR64_03270 [Desulfatitalea sp. BRH_c12]